MSPVLFRSLRLLIVLVGVSLAIVALVAVDDQSHSVSDTLYGASVPVLLIGLLSVLALVLLERQARRGRG
jgi:hypothetical protein